MEKEGDSRDIEGDVDMLGQLISSLDESVQNLESAYKKKDVQKFNSAKKFVMSLTDKISEIAR